MKTRVKLYTHRIKSTATGQLYDVFEIRTPYTTSSPRSNIRHNNSNNSNNNQKTIKAIPPTTIRTPTDPAALTKAFDITSTKKAYAPSYKEACMFLRAIQVNRREHISTQCLRHLATFVVQSWEVEPTELKVTELMNVMQHLLDTTQIDPTVDLDEALKQSCRNTAAIPTVCPTVALLVAMRYIDRLKKKYNNIRGAMGCSHRLVVVAFMMAIKYIHANLRLIVDVTEPEDQDEQEQRQQAERRRSSSIDALVFSRLSTERSTLKKPPTPTSSPMVSPPASPKSSHHAQASLLPPTTSEIVNEEGAANKHQRALRALRMEIEFLHFLNYDLTLSDPIALVEWAHRPATKEQQQQQTVDEPSPAVTYLSADEGGDEMENDGGFSLE